MASSCIPTLQLDPNLRPGPHPLTYTRPLDLYPNPGPAPHPLTLTPPPGPHPYLGEEEFEERRDDAARAHEEERAHEVEARQNLEDEDAEAERVRRLEDKHLPREGRRIEAPSRLGRRQGGFTLVT